MGINVELVDISFLRPLELVFNSHFNNLEKMILDDGYIIKPIIADKNTGTILDGSHRYAFLLKHGYLTAPVHFVDYSSDNIRLGTKLKHRFLVDEEISLTKEMCIKRAEEGNLLPPRTTRHFFSFRKKDFIVKLSELGRGHPKDIRFLLFEHSVNYELEHNINYIKELDEEVDVIVNYLAELNETKRYIQEQIVLIQNTKEVAFFPGKFHPPHLGHLKTILKIIPAYNKVIVGISGDIPDDPMITQEDVFATLSEFFDRYDNVEIQMFSGRLIDMLDTSGLPLFDVVVSGNPAVLEWAESIGVKHQNIDRSLGELSSSYIRKS